MYKVMLVDDEPFILEGLAASIPWDNYNLHLAAQALDGESAWREILENGIDILITDIRMPKLNGVELLGRIRERSLPVKCIVLSGYSDFEYVKESARLGIENYLLKPVNLEECCATLEELVRKLDLEKADQAILTQGKEVLRENILQRWMSGAIDEGELKNKSELLGLQLDGGFRAAVVCWGERWGEKEAGSGGDVLALCREVVDSAGLGHSILQPFERVCLLFRGATAEGTLQKALTALETVLSRVGQIGVQAKAAVGNYQASYRDVGLSMNRAHRMIEYQYTRPGHRITSYEDYLREKQTIPGQVNAFFGKLAEVTVSGGKAEVMELLENLLAAIPEGLLRSDQLYSICIMTVLRILQAAAPLQLSAMPQLERMRNRMSDIYEYRESADILDWTRGQVGMLMDFLEQQRGNYSEPVTYLLFQIKHHCMDEMNLKTLAGEMDMNPFYLGQLFYSETGQHFTEYLNRQRIEHAKELLRGSCSVKEAARRSGYLNWSYFYTVFKKYVGMSPNDYRKKVRPDPTD